MNKHRLVIGNLNNPIFDIENDQLRQVDLVQRNSFSGDELAYDELNAATYAGESWGLISNEGYDLYSSQDYQLYSNPANLTDEVPTETVMRYYVDGVLKGKFYAMPAERENTLVYDVLGVSAIGLLVTRSHVGGIYNGASFQSVAAEIIGNAFPFSCSQTVGIIQVYGWLPYTRDARENLHQLLFACGVMAYKDANGDVYFDFANTDIKRTIDPNKTYMDGTMGQIETVGMVRVTEHSYIATSNDIEYTLFDNVGQTAAVNLLVTFSNAPIHDLQTTGTLEMVENGANYAILNGVGTLTGKAYTHIQQVYTLGTDENAVLEFNDQTLVNQLNSVNVAKRIKNYYSTTEIVNTDVQGHTEKPGERIAVTGPYKDAVDGYINEIHATGLATVKERLSLLTNFTPTQGGNNYEHRDIIDTNSASKTWTVPTGVTTILAVLIGGGAGGYGGNYGENGKRAAGAADPGDGGNGGAVGAGGAPAKILAQRISVTPGQVLTAVIGEGGEGGASAAYGAEQIAGADGTATTFAGYSSEDGEIPSNGFIDLIGSRVYALVGADGLCKGGKGGKAMTAYNDPTPYIVIDGESVTYKGVTYPGGRSNATVPDGERASYGTDGHGHYYSYGGGSGAVAGFAGNPGENGYISNRTIYGGLGATAPTPVAPDDVTNYGSGGTGGNGGGGGGGAGDAGNEGATTKYNTVVDRIGHGGPGSIGGKGAPGAVFIYY